MNSDNNNNSNESYATPMEDAQGHWYSSLTSADPSSSSMTPSTITHDIQIEQPQQQLSLLSTETICISTDSDDSRNEGQQTQQMPSTLTQEWLPPAASTPVSTPQPLHLKAYTFHHVCHLTLTSTMSLLAPPEAIYPNPNTALHVYCQFRANSP